jgi:hypothetical protein
MTTGAQYQRFDAADSLETLDDVAAFLEVALEDSADDPSAVPHALGIIARSQNMSDLAHRVGMSQIGGCLSSAAGRHDDDDATRVDGDARVGPPRGRRCSPAAGRVYRSAR